MCGIVGILSNTYSIAEETLKKMSDSIIHRGPDGSGHWIGEKKNIGFGHRRLSIIDLTENGAQPMHYLGRYTITYNGEIYNYLELKEDLIKKGYQFKSESDTEVILAAYDCYNENCLSYFDGMFSFAIWDEIDQTLFCARDRFGEKPFFYYRDKESNFFFASEMKALWAIGCPKAVNQKLFYYYIAHSVILNPFDLSETFYHSIFSLEPGHSLRIRGNTTTKKKYYDISTVTKEYKNDQEVYDQFLFLLQQSVSRRLRSDVAVGSSLSGGLDSSSIVSLINKISKGNAQHCFSARFKNFSKDEGDYIDLLTKQINIQRHDIWITEEESIQEIDKVIYHQEQPFQSGSIIAQWMVYKKSRQENVLVMLDGQGADEYLGGYLKDFQVFLREKFLQNPFSYKKFYTPFAENHAFNHQLNMDFLLQSISPNLKRNLSTLSRKFRSPLHKEYLHSDFYQAHVNDPSPFENFNSLKQTFKYEMLTYGLNKLLRFADRNSMGNSIEVRLPFLSHELIEFAFTLPTDLFYKDGWSKSILRNSIKEVLIPEITWRKDKIGFEAPHSNWMKNKLIVDQVQTAKAYLKQNKIINDHFDDDWNILMAYKFLNQSNEN